MNVLVVAPHPDDEALGCGGTVCLHHEAGDRISAVFFTSGELGLKDLPRDKARAVREGEATAASKVLGISDLDFLRCADWMTGADVDGIATKLTAVLIQRVPDLIYLPHTLEWHPDHKAALPIVRTACRDSRIRCPRLLGYEVWTPMPEYQEVKDISKFMARKIRALKKHASQVAGWDYVRAIRGLNQYRGVMAGRCAYAEVFQELSID